jgi:PAS domain S-box-containing protein
MPISPHLRITPTGRERLFTDKDVIVSKTDMKGWITYTNRVFMDISGFTEPELLGQPHSLIRHPDMPRAVFKLLWDNISAGHEIFAYVVNICKNGDHYWVLAHVTPSYDTAGKVIGYHSNRRVPNRTAVEQTIIPLYRKLCALEGDGQNRKDGLQESSDMLAHVVKEKGMTYNELIFALQG